MSGMKRLNNDGIPEIRLNGLQLEMRNQVQKKVENGIYEFEKVPCPICDHFDSITLGNKDRYGLDFSTQICKTCGLIYTNPRMNQDAYNEFYNNEYRKMYVGKDSATKIFFEDQRSKGSRIFSFLRSQNLLKDQNKFILEVGCGAGGILHYFKEKGHHVMGIDLGKEYLEYGKNEFNLELTQGSLRDIKLERTPDLIIYSHVLEHILDLGGELKLLKELSGDDTIIYIEVPGIKEIHKNYGMNILKYLQNAHTYHFTLISLKNLMSKYGFELIGGNEFVRAAFRPSDYSQAFVNDFDEVTHYIKKIENRRYTYFITPRFFGKLFRKTAMNILDFIGLKKQLKKIYHAINSNS